MWLCNRLKLDIRDIFFISLLFMTFYTAPIFSYSPIRFSDIGLFLLSYLALKNRSVIIYQSNSLFFFLFGLWAIFDVFLLSFAVPTFDIANHFIQLIRLEAAIFLFVLLPNTYVAISKEDIIIIFRKIILFHVTIQIVYVLFYYCGFSSVFNLIHNFEERGLLISNNSLFTNHFIIVNVEKGTPRFSGLFEEPAWFGWTITLLIAFVLQAELLWGKIFLKKKDWIKISIAYLFLFSISAFCSLFIVVLFYYIAKNKNHIFKLISIVFSFSIGVGIYLFLSPSMLSRLLLMSEGSDGSTSSRLLGSLNGFLTTISVYPFTGYGFGDTNTSLFFDYAMKHNLEKGINVGSVYILDMHNILFQVFCSFGFIGAFFFLYPFARLFKNRCLLVLLSFFLVFFSVNVFNTFFLFAMLSMSFFLFHDGKCTELRSH